MKFATFFPPLAVICAVIATFGCESGDPAAPGGRARLSIYLTDAPGDVERAWVEILEVSLRSEGERLTFVPEDIGLIELTDLVDRANLLVEEQEIDAGLIQELRLVIGDGVLEAKSGDVYVLGDPELPPDLGTVTGQLQCPSCQQSGIKIKVSNDQIEVEEGEYILLLDFDVAQTYGHRAGNSGRWIMHPVVHADLIPVEALDSALNELQGVVVLASGDVPECPAGTARSVEDFVPMATAQTLVDGDGAPIVRTAVVGPTGTFGIGGLEADSYTLSYQTAFDFGTHTLTFEATVLPAEVTIDDGVVVGAVAYTVTDATCTPAP